METIYNGKQEVTVTDIKMPFMSMVVFMIKWTVASIPAMILLAAAVFGLIIIGTMLLAMLGAGLGSLAR